jgi:hypothetical protein
LNCPEMPRSWRLIDRHGNRLEDQYMPATYLG